ncbi:protein NSP-INTERACTING KINASE 3-like [Oryza brachyantha]|uniref:protein NSP-INTERACTING KINASE 3-like n=1 Tax=Oryza brachyantha TaxID=4533 RepID=UPI001ADC0CDA|nr:protein NSP-INTERACTING KINASE 3-like [Oryza brachyantha]
MWLECPLLQWKLLLMQILVKIAVNCEAVNYKISALVAIKAALHDKSNVLGDWKASSGGAGGPCHWSLVFCSDDGHVNGLEMVHQNLSGALSPAIGKLRRLQFLLLQHNDISGPIPETLGRLKLLQRLDLAFNQFTGTIPGTLGHPRDIFFVRLSHNNLSGSIPDSLATSQSVYLLDLSYNNLSGPVPNFIVKNVYFAGNPLLHNLSREGQSCSYVVQEPVDIPSAKEEPVVITEHPSTHNKNGLSGTARLVSLYIAAALLIAFLIAGIIAVVWQWRSRHQIFADLDGLQIRLGHLKQFTIKEIQEATNNFDRNNILGQGGFGVVYKGRLRDGTIVAVKRMKDCGSVCGDNQFHTEVEVISLIVHRNLLRLIGFCVTDSERLLIYPFISNGTVSSKLQEYICGDPTLDWSRRRRIALGTARGLVYLHEQCDPKIIHRDIKASNVLLDECLEAVVADFGLAKLLDHGESHAVTAVRGTLGRIPPEYLMTGQTSEKTDVYGFGFLLIELITGRKTMELHEDEYQEGGILDWAKELLEENKLSSFVDSRLRDSYAIAELEEMVQIALLCTVYSPDHRPSMSEIVRMLEESDGSAAEKWEALKNVNRSKPSTPEFMLSPPVNFGPDEYDSIQLEAVELSGPR